MFTNRENDAIITNGQLYPEVNWAIMEDTNGRTEKERTLSPRYSRALIIAVSVILSSVLVTLSALDTKGIFSLFLIGTAAAVMSFGLFVTRSTMVFLSVPLSAAASIVITLNAYAMINTLMTAVSCIALTYCAYKRKQRTDTVILISSAAIYVFVVCSAVTILLESGTFTGETIMAYLRDILEPIRIILSNTSIVNPDGEIIYFYTAEQVELIVRYAMTLLPSVIICAANLFSFFTSAVFHFIMKRFGIAKLLYTAGERGWGLKLSPVSAVIFAVSYLLAVLFRSDTLTALPIVMINLLIILTPGFALVGMRDIIRRMQNSEEFSSSPFYLVALIFLIVINPIACFILLAFFGVVVTFAESMRIRRTEN